jgi:DNA modification methylase
MWAELKRIIKPNGAIVLFGSEPFSSALRMSNIKQYKYDWKWEKEQGLGNLNAKKRPLVKTEDICVFYKKQCLYNPQMTKGKPYTIKRNKNKSEFLGKNGTKDGYITENNGERYPVNIIFEKRELTNRLHPTQKPVALIEYLIKTYTNE